MPIKVAFLEMKLTYIPDIIEYYNYLRPDGSDPIEYLDCKEGGYQILCSDKKNVFYGKYKQLRWHRKILISYYNYPSFTIEEELLLYNMMRYALGKENVAYYLSYDQAIKHSPSFKSDVLSSILLCDSAFRKLPIDYEENSDASSQSSSDECFHAENHKSSNFKHLKNYNGTPKGRLARDSSTTLPINELKDTPITNRHRFIRRNTEPLHYYTLQKPLDKFVDNVYKIFAKSEKEKMASANKQIIIDNSELSLSTTSGWKYPRIRI